MTAAVHAPVRSAFDRSARLLILGVAVTVAYAVVLAAQPADLTLWLADLAIVALLAANVTAFYTTRSYSFSTGFWTALFFFFYFVLKSSEYFGERDVSWVVTALWQCALFLLAYNIGYGVSARRAGHAPRLTFEAGEGKRLARTCLIIFLVSRLAYYATVSLVLQGDYNVIDISESTQNQGMAYIFKAFSIGYLALLMLLAYGFIHRRHLGYAAVGACIFLLDVVNSAGRGTLIVTILAVMFLYDRHVRRVSWLWLAVVAPFLVFIVSFFGYVRSIELGSLSAYQGAFEYFADEPDVVWRLFIGRLDLLPTVAGALEALARGELHALNGSSYVDAFLHFIPRNLWPSKPPLTSAYVTAVVAPGPFEAGVLIYPTMTFEGVLNFGLAGIAAAGAFAGFLAARYDGWMRRHDLRSTFFVLTFFTFPMGLIAEGIHSNYVATALYTAALAWLLIVVLHRLGAIELVPGRHGQS